MRATVIPLGPEEGSMGTERTTAEKPQCSGPALDKHGRRIRCQNEARAEDLCATHYRQLARARKRGKDPWAELKPIKHGSGVRIPGLTVSERAGEALRAKDPNLYTAAKDVLETWAKRQGKRGGR